MAELPDRKWVLIGRFYPDWSRDTHCDSSTFPFIHAAACIHLLSSIGTQQFSVQSCLARNINQPLCPHVFELLYSRASPCSFSKEIIIRMGSLSRIPADALHQSYSTHCHIGKLLSKGKNLRILPFFLIPGTSTRLVALSMAPQCRIKCIIVESFERSTRECSVFKKLKAKGSFR